MNLVLIGPRGVGKSSLSRRLSVETRLPVLSTDLLIRYDSGGQEIADLVAEADGDWRPFRELEWRVVEKVAALDGIIVDAGGGVVVDLDEDGCEILSRRKVAALRKNGFVVWLSGDPARLAAKVAADPSRPSLSAIHSLEMVMRARIPFYGQAADLVVDVEGRDKRGILREILREWESLTALPRVSTGLT